MPEPLVDAPVSVATVAVSVSVPVVTAGTLDPPTEEEPDVMLVNTGMALVLTIELG